MTLQEARDIFGLKENDKISKNGLQTVKKSVEHQMEKANVFEKSKYQKQLEAIKLLIENLE